PLLHLPRSAPPTPRVGEGAQGTRAAPELAVPPRSGQPVGAGRLRAGRLRVPNPAPLRAPGPGGAGQQGALGRPVPPAPGDHLLREGSTGRPAADSPRRGSHVHGRRAHTKRTRERASRRRATS